MTDTTTAWLLQLNKQLAGTTDKYGDTIFSLWYLTITMDGWYQSMLYSPLVTAPYLAEKLLYDCVHTHHLLATLYGQSVHLLIPASAASNEQQVTAKVQQLVSTSLAAIQPAGSTMKHQVTCVNNPTDAKGDGVPASILQTCLMTAINHSLNEVGYINVGGALMHVDLTQTSAYQVCNTIKLHAANDGSNADSLQVQIELSETRLKLAGLEELQPAMSSEDAAEVYCLPNVTRASIASIAKGADLSMNLSDFWLYKYGIKLPEQQTYVTVQFRAGGQQLHYPSAALLSSTPQTVRKAMSASAIYLICDSIKKALTSICLEDSQVPVFPKVEQSDSGSSSSLPASSAAPAQSKAARVNTPPTQRNGFASASASSASAKKSVFEPASFFHKNKLNS